MSLWQFLAASDGYVAAHGSSDGKSGAISDEQFNKAAEILDAAPDKTTS